MESIEISSYNSPTNKNNVLRQRLSIPIYLDGYCRLASANMWYNLKNITNKLGNNKVTVYKDNTAINITIVDGSYSISDLSNYIANEVQRQNGYVMKNKIFQDNPTYNRITLNLTLIINRIQFDKKFGYMIGNNTIDATETNTNYDTATGLYTYAAINTPDDFYMNFSYVPNIENVQSVHINCNLVNNSIQKDNSLLYRFTPSQKYGTLISLEPLPLWKKMRQGAYEQYVEIVLTDQNGNDLEIEDDISFSIVLSDKSFIT